MRVIHLARKPLSEGTVVSNVMAHGTGAVNIDMSRICSGDQPKPTTAPGWDSFNKANAAQGYRPMDYKQGPAEYIPSVMGRWPANVVLEHLASCECLGTTKVAGRGARESSVGQGREGNHTNGIYGAKASKVTTAYVQEDGTEEVVLWSCAPGCPVDALEDQTGTGAESEHKGGVSRFFKQVKA